MNVTGVVAQLRTTDLAGRQVFHLKLAEERDPSIAFVDAGGHVHLYLDTADATADAAALQQRGVRLVHEVHDTPWDTREFAINGRPGAHPLLR